MVDVLLSVLPGGNPGLENRFEVLRVAIKNDPRIFLHFFDTAAASAAPYTIHSTPYTRNPTPCTLLFSLFTLS